MGRPSESMTIDELARKTRITSRTIRLYQTKGLLPHPHVVGRTGYYGDEHVTRLTTIDRLQRRGFSLGSIHELIKGAQKGDDLQEFVGAEAILGKRWSEDRAVPMAKSEFERQLGTPADDALVARTEQLGLIRRTGDPQMLELVMPEVVQFGFDLIREGAPLDAVLDVLTQLQREMLAVVQRFAEILRGHVLPRVFAEDPEHALSRLAEFAKKLEPMMRTVVLSTLNAAIDRHMSQLTSKDFTVLEEAKRARRSVAPPPAKAPRKLPRSRTGKRGRSRR